VCFDADYGSNFVDAPRPILWSRDHKDTSLKKSLFTTFFFDELVPYLDKNYRVNPQQRMLTGFSMGAYGAYHYMLTKPDMFVSVGFMSGWFPGLIRPAKEEVRWWEPVLGPYAGNESFYKAADI